MREGQVFTTPDVKGLYEMIRDYGQGKRTDDLRTHIYSINGETAGFISFGKDLGDETWEIYLISVARKHWGKNIGKKLIKHAEKHIRQKNGRMILISTSSAKEYQPARRTYKKTGYTQAAKIKDCFQDHEHKIILHKRLKPTKPLLTPP
jgi:ribosomal protein S18 acetylase RimI-like enzyme